MSSILVSSCYNVLPGRSAFSQKKRKSPRSHFLWDGRLPRCHPCCRREPAALVRCTGRAPRLFAAGSESGKAVLPCRLPPAAGSLGRRCRRFFLHGLYGNSIPHSPQNCKPSAWAVILRSRARQQNAGRLFSIRQREERPSRHGTSVTLDPKLAEGFMHCSASVLRV